MIDCEYSSRAEKERMAKTGYMYERIRENCIMPGSNIIPAKRFYDAFKELYGYMPFSKQMVKYIVNEARKQAETKTKRKADTK